MRDHHPNFCIVCGSKLEMKTCYGGVHPACPACEWVHFSNPKVAIAGWIIRDGKLLLIKRKNDPGRGKWSLPAGFMNAHETPQSCLKRECQEETGLIIKPGRFIQIFAGISHPNGADLLLVYEGQIENGQLCAGDDALEAAFFELQEIPPLAFDTVTALLDNNQAS